MAAQVQALPVDRPLWRRTLWPLLVVVALAAVYLAARALPIDTSRFPEAWNVGLRAQVDAFQDWVIGNRATSPVFVYLIDPLSAGIDAGLRWAEDFLLSLSWLLVIATFATLGYLRSGWRLALFCAIGLLLAGGFGLWQQTMQTLALMAGSVLLALLLGIPLGILTATYSRFDRALRRSSTQCRPCRRSCISSRCCCSSGSGACPRSCPR